MEFLSHVVSLPLQNNKSLNIESWYNNVHVCLESFLGSMHKTGVIMPRNYLTVTNQTKVQLLL